MTVNHDVVSSSLTSAAFKRPTGLFFYYKYRKCLRNFDIN